MFHVCFLHHVQNALPLCSNAGFGSVLHSECRVQKCVVLRMQGSGVRYAQNAGIRSALCSECRDH
ncbi:hypothetical protein AB205_0144420 [Aquarana catesbeiana]|uniref:Uncharacterized protein n=1 Tax=Aquarana catesbeiana TaxID=8400 RepID=A0A2G9Q4G4_AQUCT|nr:hypothetical protein AB205_0144420 [Aquarana catesbeiana]